MRSLLLARRLTSDNIVSLGLTLNNARIDYAGHTLFRDLTARLDAGSWTALLGRSGCGKSSLLRLLAGLEMPDRHQLELHTDDGRPLVGRIAWMAQQDLLLPWRRVLDNLCLGDDLHRRPRNVARARELLSAVGLEGREHSWPDALSGGQRQRVALARTLYQEAPVVMMDEPFSAVDAITRLELHDLASRLLDGRTVLMVTHDPLEALRLADQLLVLRPDAREGYGAVLDRLPGLSPPRPVPLDTPALQQAQAELIARLRDPNEAFIPAAAEVNA
ncbi:ABC transporter ATP-binding protein [Cobetia crustatorum]|uniref:ABC transporter ATP-binding protein n=1 Tax=Cobetia crustatorum TaxID=553385 RepID=UPI001FE88CC9|nr:ABC transporter ATP-binding protein [Cobetia crustatorum]